MKQRRCRSPSRGCCSRSTPTCAGGSRRSSTRSSAIAILRSRTRRAWSWPSASCASRCASTRRRGRSGGRRARTWSSAGGGSPAARGSGFFPGRCTATRDGFSSPRASIRIAGPGILRRAFRGLRISLSAAARASASAIRSRRWRRSSAWPRSPGGSGSRRRPWGRRPRSRSPADRHAAPEARAARPRHAAGLVSMNRRAALARRRRRFDARAYDDCASTLARRSVSKSSGERASGLPEENPLRVSRTSGGMRS